MPSEGLAAAAAVSTDESAVGIMAGAKGAVAIAAADLIRPEWPAPAMVGALMSTRRGGVSTGPWVSLNLARSAGDAPEAVAENWRRFAASLGPRPVRPIWLRQVHGIDVLELDAAAPEGPATAADAAWTRTPGVACVVGAADCMPVLFATRDGRAVAAAHAGWRGLAAGVLEATVAALAKGTAARASDLLAWMGPCIGPRHFEVGADVLAAFGASPGSSSPDARHFRDSPRPDGTPRWRADLQGLARRRLEQIGVGFIGADPSCTYEDASRFFSFRRDGGCVPTGRMAAAIWIAPRG